ncbi:RNA-guided endonuclease InsQ/TnpB family protein [Natrialbaceae archaeon A-gly3]
MASDESHLSVDYTGETDTLSPTRTIRLKLETSNWKNEQVREAIDDWQTIAETMAAYLPSFVPSRWGNRDTQITRVAAKVEPDDHRLYAHDRNAAANKVREAFHSWNERGRTGAHPRGEFGDGNYLQVCSCCTKPSRRVEIVPNERGYGLWVNLCKGEDPLWFHIDTGEYQREFLEDLVDGELDYGALELRLQDDRLVAHLSVTDEIEVYRPADVDTHVGVDLGENTLYAAAIVTDGDVEQVEMKSGRKFRHHRDQLDRRRAQVSEKGDRKAVEALSGERRRYTEHVTHTASREIVTLAEKHAPAVIHLEDLTGYRETAEDPIHDWPQGMLREQIAYKATDVGIPVEEVDPDGTSIECRKCGRRNPDSRDGNTFYCRSCDYEVHADVNAAINIANR